MKKLLLSICLVTLGFPMFGKAEWREAQSLDGAWEITFDPSDEGQAAKWYMPDVFQTLENRRKISVPSCWEEIEKDYEGVAFYRRQFLVSNDWKNRTIRFHFDAVNYITEVWLNGHAIGCHEGGYGPFEFRVDDLIQFEETNSLTVRVLGPIITKSTVIDGLGKNDAPHWRGAIAGGIWQSVGLTASGPVLVDDVFVIPQLKDDTAKIQFRLDNTDVASRDATVKISITDKAGPVIEKTGILHLVPGKNSTERVLSIPNAKRWSPDEPNLYTATVQVDGSDEETIRFGMRELTISNKQFELNGKPIYIKAAFFEGLYPNRLAVPDSREVAVREIQLAKEAGFNMIRPWRKPPPPMWLDLCDEMGVMVIGGLPIECMDYWPTVTPELPDRIENEVRSAISRDRNRACIVQWEIFNEIWRPELKRLKHPVSMLAREMDPTRLILDESGGFADVANIYLPYRFEPEKFNDIHIYPGAPLDDETYSRLLVLGRTDDDVRAMGLDPDKLRNKNSSPDRMTLVSELGYGSTPDLTANKDLFEKYGNPLTPPYRYHLMLEETTRAALKESGLDKVYPDLQQFCLAQQQLHADANKRMIEAVRSNDRVRGYCIHALTAGDWVLGAGLLDLWRNPKLSYWGTKEANQPRYLTLRIMPRNIYSAQPARITVTGINDLQRIGGTLELVLKDISGKTVRRFESKVELASGVSSLFSETLDASAMTGAYEARVKLLADDGSLVAENKTGFNVFNGGDLAIPAAKIAVLDPDGKLYPFLNAGGIAYEVFGNGTPETRPVFVATAEAKTPETKAAFRMLESFVRRGGTAIYLEALVRQSNPYWWAGVPSKDVLPVKVEKQHAYGLWVGVSHIVTDHPVFAGLPVNCMMGQEYEKVWSPYVLKNTGGELIVGSISYGFHSKDSEHQNYTGPEPAWYGMDMGVVPYGQGRYVLSTLCLLENLGKDPVSDKILLNLIKWTGH